ncbi:MAG: hypothetical protein RLP98_13565 [Devosia sp.]
MEPQDVVSVLAAGWQALSEAIWLQSLITGAAGVAVGSFSTQAVINRHQQLVSARAELTSTKKAINLCFVILNQYLAFKRQMVAPMVVDFETLDRNIRAALASPIKGEVLLETDFKMFPPITAPVAHLDTVLTEKVTMGGKGLAAALQISGISEALNKSIEQRNQMISAFEHANLKPIEMAERYLGLETDKGADTRLKDNVHAISLYTDDAIFFTHTSLQELQKHGERLIRRTGRKLGSKRDLGSFALKDSAKHLMPTDAQYVDWLNGFKETKRWWMLWGKR